MTRRIGLSLLAAVIVFVGLPGIADAGDLIYRPYSTWNGKRIYISPARHTDTGGRGECRRQSENLMAWRTAYHATSGRYYADREQPDSPWRNLRSRGYLVRVGRGTVSSAVRNSNAWGANVHIPVHSNADVAGRCNRTNRDRFGTIVIYKTYGRHGGQGLAHMLNDRVGEVSPGTRDAVCHNSSSCTRFNCLAELCQTRARAAYLEADFHTWNTGVDFTRHGWWWAWRLGWAVDRFLDYPRR